MINKKQRVRYRVGTEGEGGVLGRQGSKVEGVEVQSVYKSKLWEYEDARSCD